MSRSRSTRVSARSYASPAHKRLLLAAIMLLCTFVLASAPHVRAEGPALAVSLNGPSQLAPGQSGTFTLGASLGGIPILSFPAGLTVQAPDGTEVPVLLEEVGLGGYSATVYVTQEGVYTIEGAVTVGDQDAVASHDLLVRKPDFTLDSDLSRSTDGRVLEGTVTVGARGEIVIEAAPFATGTLSDKLYAEICRVPCDGTCTVSCTLPPTVNDQALLLRISTRQAYQYEIFRVLGIGPTPTGVTVERTSGVGEPVAITAPLTTELYAIADGVLSLIPLRDGELSLVPTTPQELQVLVKEVDAITAYPVSVIRRENVITPPFETASDGTESWYISFITENRDVLVQLPGPVTPRDAFFLANGTRTQLSWYKDSVQVPAGQGFLEVRRGLPAASDRDQRETAYGVLVRAQGLQRYTFPGRVLAFNDALEALPVYWNNSVSVVYAQDTAVAAVTNAGGSLTVSDPVLPNGELTISYDVAGFDAVVPDSTFAIVATDGTSLLRQTFAGAAGQRSLLASVPPGSYLALAQGSVQAATPLHVLAPNGGLTFDAAKRTSALENTTVTLTHILTNGNTAEAVRVRFGANATPSDLVVLLDGEDTDGDGVLDITIPAGQSIPISARVFLPPGSSEATVTFTATDAARAENVVQVSDLIAVTAMGLPVSLDVSVVALEGSLAAPRAILYNSYASPLTVAVTVSGGDVSTPGTTSQISLAPGLTNLSLNAIMSDKNMFTVRVAAAGDVTPTNDWRTRRLGVVPGFASTLVSEHFGRDHEQYTIELSAVANSVLTWFDSDGTQRIATGMVRTASDTVVWDLGSVKANTEFVATLVPGTLEPADIRIVLDNSDARVRTRGTWVSGTTIPGYVGFDYLIDLNLDKGGSVEYSPGVLQGQYALSIATPADPSLASNAEVVIQGARRSTVTINQRQGGEQYLGLYELGPTSTISVSNAGTSELVVVDALTLIPISQVGYVQFSAVVSPTINETVVGLNETGNQSINVTLPVNTTLTNLTNGSVNNTNNATEFVVPLDDAINALRNATENDTQSNAVIGERVQWTRVVVVDGNSTNETNITLPATVLSVVIAERDDETGITQDSAESLEIDTLIRAPVDAPAVTVQTEVIDAAPTLDELLAENIASEVKRSLEAQGELTGIEAREARIAIVEITETLTENAQTQDIERAEVIDALQTLVPESSVGGPAGSPVVSAAPLEATQTTLDAIPDLAPGVALVTVPVTDEATDALIVTYETEAPQLTVTEVAPDRLLLTVHSETHYTNIESYLDVAPFTLGEVNKFVLYRTTDGLRERVSITPADVSGDGVFDRITWIVPHLSNQTYELSLSILNPLAFLRDGETWAVYFNTTGTGNLSITSPNANWTELLVDSNGLTEELTFFDIRCDGASIASQLTIIATNGSQYAYTTIDSDASIEVAQLFVENYSCDGATGELRTVVNIAGYAILNFTFTDGVVTQSELAIDPSPIEIGFANPTPQDASVLNANNFTVNVSVNSSSLLGFAYLWNGTNYTIYNDTALQVMFNFDNVSALGENATRAIDVSRNAIAANITGSATPNTTGVVRGGMSLYGTNGMINTSTNLTTWLGRTATLSLWMRTNQTGSANPWTAPGITGIEQGGGGDDIFWGWINAAGNINIQAGNGANAASTIAINDGSWRHFTFTRDETTGTVNLYINGILNATAASETGRKTLQFTGFGVITDTAGPGSDDYFVGAMDEIRVWNRTLSSAEIYQSYLSSLNKVGASQWSFVANQTGVGEAEYTIQACATNATLVTCISRTLGVNTTPAQYNARVSVWDTKNTTSRADDELIGTQAKLQVSPNGTVRDVGKFLESVYSYSTYLVEVQIESERIYAFDSDYHAETVIIANNSFATANSSTVAEYLIPTTWVTNDGTQTADIFISTTNNPDYTVDANVGEVGRIMGDPDAAVLVSGSDDIVVYTNPASNKFSAAWAELQADASIGATSTENFIAAADFDLNGYTDLAVSNNDEDLRIYQNDGTPFVGVWTEVTADNNLGQDVYSVAVADFDNDGYPDLIGGTVTTDDVLIFQNDRTPFVGAWTEQIVELAAGGDVNSLATGDMDADGDIDIVGAIEGVSDITWWTNDGTPFNGAWTATDIDTATGLESNAVVVADFDRDGYLDVAQGDDDEDVDVYCTGGTAGAWTEFAASANVGGDATALAVGDIDNDGDVDIIVAVETANDIVYLENDGTPCAGAAWTQRTIDNNVAATPWGVFVSDIDGNGWLDILAGINDQDVMSIQNDGTPANGGWVSNDLDIAAGNVVAAIVGVDLDQDATSNVLDFFSSVTENAENGTFEIGNWSNLNASLNYSFSFLVNPDYDFRENATTSFVFKAGNESQNGWTRTTELLASADKTPIRVLWNWTVNKPKYTIADGMSADVTAVNVSFSTATPYIVNATCHAIDNETRLDKYEWYNYNVTFALNSSSTGTNVTLGFNTTNSTGSARYAFEPTVPGNYSLVCAPIRNISYFDYPGANANMSTNLTVYGFMNVTSMRPPANTTAYSATNMTCRVQDRRTQANVTNANVSFYANGTLLGTNLTNASGNATLFYTLNVTGVYNVTCNVSDQPAIFYYAGGARELNATQNVSTWALTPVSPINGTNVDRDGTNISVNDSILLNFTVAPGVPTGTNISFLGNLTNPGTLSQTNILFGTNNTTAGGWVALYYNVPSTVYAGNWTVWANGSGSYPNGSRYMHIYGTVNITYAHALYNPNASVYRPSNNSLIANVTSYGIENTSVLNSSYVNYVNVTIRNATGAAPFNNPLRFNGTTWNSTLNFTSNNATGNWNTTLNASVSWFYINFSENRTIILNSTPPTHSTPILNATDNPLNLTTANLTLYNISTWDVDGINPVKNIVVWKVNGTEYAVMQLPFAGGSNSTFAKDYSGDSNGSVSGATWNETGGPDSRGSYIFNGVNNAITFGYTSRTNISRPPITVSAWVRLNSIGLDQKIVSKRPSWVLAVYTDNQLEYEMFNSGTSSLSIGGNFRTLPGTALTAGRWYHLVGSWDGANMRTYINGSLDATQPYAVATIDTTPFNVTVGRTADALGNWFAGQITDVRVYDRNLTTQQIDQIYDEGLNVSLRQEIKELQTTSTDTWSACITPNDGYVDGAELCSNGVLINGIVSPTLWTNGTEIDRDNTSATVGDLLIFNATTYGESGASVVFYANLTSPAGISGTTNLVLGSNTTNSAGIAGILWDANATTWAGNYTWWVTSTGRGSVGIGHFTVMGSLNVTSWNTTANPSLNHTINESVEFRYNFTSRGGPETRLNLSVLYNPFVGSALQNPNGTVYRNTTTYSTVGTYWNSTNRFLMGPVVGVWNLSTNGSANWFFNATNHTDNTTVFGLMNITANTTVPAQATTFENFTFTCRVQGMFTNYSVPNATMTFYANSTLLGVNITNGTGFAGITHAINQTGTYNIMCNVSNQTNISYLTGNRYTVNSSLVVVGFLINVTSPVNTTRIDRDDLNSGVSDSAVLNVSVRNSVPDGVRIDFYANRTLPAGVAQNNIFIGNNTTFNASAAFLFDANASWFAGNYTWWGQNANGTSNRYGQFAVIGALNVSFNSTTLNPNATYVKPSTVIYSASLVSYGPENASVLNSSFVNSVNLSEVSGNGTNTSKNLVFNGTNWANSTSIVQLSPRGWWNVTLRANTGQYFYFPRNESRVFQVNNTAPTQGTPILNSTNDLNLSNANITAYNTSTADVDGDRVTNMWNWTVNGRPIGILYAPFDTVGNSTNITGAVRDYFGNATGSCNVSAGGTCPIFNASGISGSALSFYGTGVINFSNRTEFQLASNYTVMMWVYATSGANSQRLISKQNGGTGGWEMLLRTTGGNPLMWDDGPTYTSSPGAWSTNTWVHVAFTNNATTNAWYVNGTAWGTNANAGTPSNNVSLVVGGRSDMANFFSGKIDDLRIYNRTLTPGQIQQIALETRNNYTSSSIAPGETRGGEVWRACVTPNDNWTDGATACTNNLTVIGIANAVGPANGSLLDRDGTVAADSDNLTLIASTDGDSFITVTFKANLTDPSGLANYTNVTIGRAVTNSTGFATINYNPSSTNITSWAGNWTWWAEAINYTSVDSMTFIIMGTANTTLWNATFFPNATHLQNESIIVRANITGYGNESRLNFSTYLSAGVTTKLTNTTNGTQNLTASFTSLTNAYWNTSHNPLVLLGPGIWNVTVNASMNYYYPMNASSRNVTVYGFMNVTANSTSPAVATAYDTTTASCTISDQHANYSVAGANVSFYVNGTLFGSNVTNAVGLTTLTFAVNTSGTYAVQCNVTNQTAIYYLRGDGFARNSSLTIQPFRVNAASPANNSRVDRDGADPTDSDTIMLNATVPSTVPDGLRIEFRANLTNPTGIIPSANVTNILLGNNTTVGGSAVLYVDPNASIYAGNYSWWGNASNGVANQTRTMLVYGSVFIGYLNSTSNPNATYNQTQNATVQANVTSNGPENTSLLNLSYSTIVVSGFANTSGYRVNSTLSYVNPYWNGSHLVSVLPGVGQWNSTLNVTASFFYSNVTNRTFFVYGYMNVTSNTSSPASPTTYQSIVSSCSVVDQLSNYSVTNANISFYRNDTFIGSNLTSTAGLATLSHIINATGTYRITCNVTDQPSIYYYAGRGPERNTTVTVSGFAINTTAPENGTGLDREGTNASMLDGVVLNITVPSYVPDGVRIDFLGNLTNPAGFSQTDVLLGNNTTVGGRALFYFDPNSSYYAGNWTWFGNNSGGYSNRHRFIHIYGQLTAVFENGSFEPNRNYTQNETATIRVNVTSSGPETRDQISTNYLATVNASLITPLTGNNTTGLTYSTPVWTGTGAFIPPNGVGVWNVTATAWSAWFFNSTTGVGRNTTVFGYMNVTANTSSPSTIEAFDTSIALCRVQDQHTSRNVSAANVSFYRNTTLIGTNLTNATGFATLVHTVNATGVYTITCNISNQTSIYYYSGLQPEGNSTLTVTPFALNAVSPANNSIADRDGISATDADVLRLNITVKSIVGNGVRIDFYGNLTDPVSLGQTYVFFGNNTTQGGSAVLFFDPNSSIYAGNYTWFGNASSAYTNRTQTLLVYGGLNATYRSALYNPNSTYNQTDLPIVEVNVTSRAGPETRDEISTVYAGAGRSIFGNGTGQTVNTSLSYTTPYWNATQNLTRLPGVNRWNSTVNVTATFFYSNATNRTFQVYGVFNITGNQTTPATATAYQTVVSACTVSDQYSNYTVASANVSFYRNGTFIGWNTTNASGIATRSHSINATGEYAITCNVSDQLSIFYLRGNGPERNSTVTITPFYLMPVNPANDTAVDRDATNSTLADVIALNVSVSTVVPAGVAVDFRGNLTTPNGLSQDNVLFGSNNTTAGNWVILYWNPNSSIYAGNWSWYANASGGVPNATRTAIVFGSLNISFTSSVINPNASYNKPATVLYEANVSSYGPESRFELNASYAANATVSLQSPNTSISVLGMEYNGSIWNASSSLLLTTPRGNWTAYLNATASRFLLVTAQNRTIVVNNIAPTHTTPVLNASDDPLNLTTASISAYNQTTFDVESDSVRNIYAWNVNGLPYAIVQLPFEGGSNSTFTRDYSGNEYNGTVGSLVNWSATGGINGSGGYDFSGVNGGISLGDLAEVDGATALTFMAWVQNDDLSDDGTLLSKGTFVAGEPLLIWRDDSAFVSGRTDTYSAMVTGNAGELRLEGATNAANTAQWQHVAVTFEANSVRGLRLFINGIEDAQSPMSTVGTTAINSNAASVVIGRPTTTAAKEFTGGMDDVRLYNRTLSQAQIQQILAEGNRSTTLFATIVANETRSYELWQACVTPNDNASDGLTNCSNTVTINPALSVTAPANDTVVDRDSADGTDPDSINLTVDANGDTGVNVTYWANISSPAIGGQTNVYLGSAVSNASGIAVLAFNPNSSFYAGNWTWWPNATNASSQTSGTMGIYGGLAITHTSQTATPNVNQTQNETIESRFNLTSQGGPETRDELNQTYLAGVTTQTANTTGFTQNATGSYTSPYWNASHVLSRLPGVGNWTSSANTSASWFYPNTTARSFSVRGLMNVTIANVTPNITSVFTPFLIRCTVADQYSNYSVNGANVSFYRDATFIGSNTTNAVGLVSLTHTINLTGIYTLTCNVSDQPSILYLRGAEPERNMTINATSYLVTTVAPANDTALDRDSGSALVADFTALNVSVEAIVPDGVRIEWYANLTSPVGVLPAQANVFLGNNTTSGGVATLWFNPNSSLYAGNYTWWANGTGGFLNGTRTFLIYGQLQTAFENASYDPNSNYTQNETATLRVNVTSPGPESRTQLSDNYSGEVNVTLVSPVNGNAVSSLSYSSSVWDGTSAFMPPNGTGVWNASATAWATWFFNSTTVGFRNTTVYGMMNVTSNVTSAVVLEVFEESTLTCLVQDQHTSGYVLNANVSFFRNGTFIGANMTNSSGYATLTHAINVTGAYVVSCAVQNQSSIFYYAGDAPQGNVSITVLPFAMNAVSPANNTIVDRDGVAADPDAVQLNITVRNTVPDGTRIDFMANLSSPGSLSQTYVLFGNNTTQGGSAVFYFNPNSSIYAGNYTWFGNHSAGYSNETRTVLVYGGLTTVYRNTTYNPNASYNQTSIALVEVNMTSTGGPETTALLNATYAGSVVNRIANTSGYTDNVSASYTGPYWNGTHALTNLYGVGTWSTLANGTASFFYTNVTNKTFTVYGFANVTSNTSTPSTIMAFEQTIAVCGVQDQLSGYAVAGSVVSFYRNGTLLGTNATNSSGVATLMHTINTTGTYSITCNISNQPAIFYYQGSEPERNSTVTVLPFAIAAVAPANDTAVDRDSGNASMADIIVLNVTVSSAVPDGVRIDFRGNLTDPSGLSQNDVLFGNNTTQGGNVVFWFNPNSSIYAGNWTWFGNASNGQANETRSILVYGQLTTVFADAVVNPDVNYTENESVTVYANVTSAGPETRDILNATFATLVNVSFERAIGNISHTLEYNGSLWNATHSITPGGPGVWNATVAAYAQWFFSNASNRTFIVYGIMNVTQASSSNAAPYAYEPFLSSCTVQNQVTAGPVEFANVSFYRNGTLIGTNLTNSTGNTAIYHAINVTGVYTITCNVTDQPAISYLRGSEPEQNTSVTVSAFPITPIAPENNTALDRDSGNVTLNDTTTLLITVPSFVPDGVRVDFRANLSSPAISPTQEAFLFGNNTTNAGTVSYYFDPNSSVYAGNWSWYGNSSAGSPNGTSSLLVFGQLLLVFENSSFSPDSNYTQNSTVALLFNITSAGPENRSALNETYGAQANTTLAAPNGSGFDRGLVFGTTTWRNDSTLIPPGGVGVWNITAAANATYFLPANISGRSSTVYGYANVSTLTLVPNPVETYQTVAIACMVIDSHTTAPVTGLNVSMYAGASLIGSNLTNATGNASLMYTPVVPGLVNITCNATSDLTIGYYVLVQNVTVELNVTPVLFTPVSPVNDTIIDRDDVSGSYPEGAVLVGRVNTGVPDGILVEFWANRTSPGGLPNSTVFLGSNMTNGTYVNFSFDPNASIFAGNWSWFMNNTGGVPNGTRSLLIYGGVNVSYQYVADSPRIEYNETDVALLALTASSFGFENASMLNETYNLTLALTLFPPIGGTTTPVAMANGTVWNTTQNLFTYGVGVWNTSAIPTAEYFFTTNFTLRNFTVYGFIGVEAFDAEEYWNGSLYANEIGHFFANVTNSTAEPLLGATCSIVFFDRNNTLWYNSTSQLYENQTAFSLEGIVPYTVTCTKAFYTLNSSSTNVSLHSATNLSARWNVTEVAAQQRLITINVSNYQNYTEHDIFAYGVIPHGLNASYGSTPAEIVNVSGSLITGTIARWYLPNITAGESAQVNFTVNGSVNLTTLFAAAVRAQTTNTSVVY